MDSSQSEEPPRNRGLFYLAGWCSGNMLVSLASAGGSIPSPATSRKWEKEMKTIELKEINICEECIYKELVYVCTEITYADGMAQEISNGHVMCVHHHTCTKAMKGVRDAIMGTAEGDA